MQAAQAGFEERAGPGPVAALIVVKGCGDLNDSLEKSLLGTGRSQPDFLPDLMGLKEAFGIELVQSPPEGFVVIYIHETVDSLNQKWRSTAQNSMRPSTRGFAPQAVIQESPPE
jgi:hypothetical protein